MLTTLLSQGKAWHSTWMSPVLSERRQDLVDFYTLSFCKPLHLHTMLPKLPQGLGIAMWRLLPIGVITVNSSSLSLHFIFPCLSILVGRLTGGNWGHALHPLFPKSPAGLLPYSGW